ncbi:MAG: hypothetical protein KBD16_02820 [Candidatus Pacebacteria bacterium]|nr:hypothetical protein [Candidatus Paceibacterota bacterium]
MTGSHTIRRILITVAVVLVLGYTAFEARGLVRGPIITIENPLPGTTSTEPLIHIIGKAENISAIMMNGRPIFISEEGRIDEPVALLSGYNEVYFVGTDRFGKQNTLILPLTYTASDTPMMTMPAATSSDGVLLPIDPPATTTEGQETATSSS